MKRFLLIALFSLVLVPASWAHSGKSYKAKAYHKAPCYYSHHTRGYSKSHAYHDGYTHKKRHVYRPHRKAWRSAYYHPVVFREKGHRHNKKYKKARHSRKHSDYDYIKFGHKGEDGYFEISLGKEY